MKKLEKYLMPLGMIGVIAYLIHTFLGNILWEAYNPITMDISSLTAIGAPNAELLRIFTTIYGLAVILFVTGMVIKSFRKYNKLTRAGYIILLTMELISLIGYGLFPLTGDKTVMTFQNMMHIIVTAVVVFSTIAFGFVLAAGYLKQAETKKLGKFVLIMAVVITLMGVINPISMGAGLNILGVTERLVIYSLQTLILFLSYYYTFGYNEKDIQ